MREAFPAPGKNERPQFNPLPGLLAVLDVYLKVAGSPPPAIGLGLSTYLQTRILDAVEPKYGPAAKTALRRYFDACNHAGDHLKEENFYDRQAVPAWLEFVSSARNYLSVNAPEVGPPKAGTPALQLFPRLTTPVQTKPGPTPDR